jgi:hypothetical protein
MILSSPLKLELAHVWVALPPLVPHVDEPIVSFLVMVVAVRRRWSFLSVRIQSRGESRLPRGAPIVPSTLCCAWGQAAVHFWVP